MSNIQYFIFHLQMEFKLSQANLAHIYQLNLMQYGRHKMYSHKMMSRQMILTHQHMRIMIQQPALTQEHLQNFYTYKRKQLRWLETQSDSMLEDFFLVFFCWLFASFFVHFAVCFIANNCARMQTIGFGTKLRKDANNRF